MRNTKAAIREQIEELQRLGHDVAVETQSGITNSVKFTNKSEDRDLTIRMTTSEAQIWLNGYKVAHNERDKR